MSHPPSSARLNQPYLLCVLVVETETTNAVQLRYHPTGTAGNRRTPMFDRFTRWQPDQGAAMAARAVGALALAALTVIHVVDLPGTLGPDRPVGIGYLGIIAGAILVGGVLIARPHWLAWAAAGAVAASAMTGYVLTRGLQGGFLGDHGDVGNWHCP